MLFNARQLPGAVRSATALFLPLVLSACGGPGDTGPESSTSSSGSSTSTSSSSSSSASSSSSSSSSASSTTSSSGFVHTIGLLVDAEGFCGTTTGELRADEAGFNGSGYLVVDAAVDNRIDVPDVFVEGGPGVEPSRFKFRYANGSGEAIPMSVWLNGRPTEHELLFPPTNSWWDWQELSVPGGGQLSLLGTAASGALYLDSISFSWRLDCGSAGGCGWRGPELRDCPAEDALPGIARTEPMPPEAFFTMTPDRGEGPTAVTLDASESFDANFDPLMFDWEFGADKHASGVTVLHEFNPGEHFIRLTATDSGGLSDTYVQRLRIDGGDPQNTAPEAIVTASRTKMVLPNTAVTLSGVASMDTDGDELSYAWVDNTQSFNQQVWYTPEIQLEPQHSTLLQFWVNDGRGGTSVVRVSLDVRDTPEKDCSVLISEHYRRGVPEPDKRISVTVYNLDDEPVPDWSSEWYIDGVEPITVTGVQGATLDGENPLRLTMPDGRPDMPPSSWVYVHIDIDTDSKLDEITARPVDGRECVEHRITYGSPPSSSSSSTTSTTASTTASTTSTSTTSTTSTSSASSTSSSTTSTTSSSTSSTSSSSTTSSSSGGQSRTPQSVSAFVGQS